MNGNNKSWWICQFLKEHSGNLQFLKKTEEAPPTVEVSRDRLTCKICHIGPFETIDAFRRHFKDPQHLVALQAQLESSSDEEECIVDSASAFMHFSSGAEFKIYKCIVTEKEINLHDAISGYWVLLMHKGGRFHAAVYDPKAQSALDHASFKRYTTRRKQGGLQSSSDASGGHSRSAGASLRRHNETELGLEIERLLMGWKEKEYLSTAKFIFWNRSRYNQSVLFRETVLSKGTIIFHF